MAVSSSSASLGIRLWGYRVLVPRLSKGRRLWVDWGVREVVDSVTVGAPVLERVGGPLLRRVPGWGLAPLGSMALTVATMGQGPWTVSTCRHRFRSASKARLIYVRSLSLAFCASVAVVDSRCLAPVIRLMSKSSWVMRASLIESNYRASFLTSSIYSTTKHST